MVGGSRYYENTIPDFREEDTPLLDPVSKKLSWTLSAEIQGIHERLKSILDKNSHGTGSDVSVYTGKPGLAYLYLLLAEKEQDPVHLQKGLELIQRSLRRLRGRDVTFLCGDVGPLCIAAVLFHQVGQVEASQDCVTSVLDLLPVVLDLQSELPNELLYGRVGYLYGLLFLRKHIPNSVSSQHLKPVAEAVIAAGHRSGKPPLMWNWHGKEYLGAAHGVAGILYLLLQVKEELSGEHLALIKRTVDYLISIRLPSGNLPSSIGSIDDRLVHWCHGAPGFVQTLLAAHEVWKDEKYMRAANQCGEVVWRRGLLKKGYGICHGVAGNAYTFLALYQATGKEVQLYRAVQFARWCGTYDRNQERPPDRPFSLFEGLAGTIYFLKDIQDPVNALFPGYSLSPFQNLSV